MAIIHDTKLDFALQALFQDAWQALQGDMAHPDVLIAHKALHISAQLAEQAQAAAQGSPTSQPCPCSVALSRCWHNGHSQY